MDYLCSTLNVITKYEKWEKSNQLPYYILDRYQIELVWIDQIRTLFLYPRTELERISTIKNHIQRIQAVEKLPAVLILNTITRQRRQYLLDARIPFIVAEKQIYLPFMGVALQEKYEAEYTVSKKLQPSAQLLLLYYIYQNTERLYAGELTGKFGVTSMTITRSVKQLEQTGLFFTEKDGVQKILIAKQQRQKLFEQIKPWTINPVRKNIYISKNQVEADMLKAGYTALAEKSMLNPSPMMSYAIKSEKDHAMESTTQLFDTDRQVQLQLWKYDPHILSANGSVDTLSLALTLVDDGDERVEDAVEDMLNELWEELDGNRI